MHVQHGLLKEPRGAAAGSAAYDEILTGSDAQAIAALFIDWVNFLMLGVSLSDSFGKGFLDWIDK